MKTSTAIKSIALVLAAGCPVVAFAEFLGASLPSILNAENALGLFTTVCVALTLIADYSRRSNVLVASTSAPKPATVRAAHESHRLAA